MEAMIFLFILHPQSVERKPGDRWMIRGPVEYVPPVEVDVLMKRQTIPLDENEGIYVRDVKTGKVCIELSFAIICTLKTWNISKYERVK